MGLRTEMVKRWPALAPLLGKDAERIRRKMARTPELIAHNLSMLSYEVGERSLKADVTWYRGEHCNFLPDRKALSEPDALARYLGQGWLPARPFITKTDPITTFGSCFAEAYPRLSSPKRLYDCRSRPQPYGEDRRHVRTEVVSTTMEFFARRYLVR